MRTVPLTVVKGGIDRLRTKGGAKAETLYELVNAYVTAAGTIRGRPGSFTEAVLPQGVFGLVAHAGQLHVFAAQTGLSIDNPRFVIHLLVHPDGVAVGLKRVHFAKPFLAALYVVAEWLDGQIFHYWLQNAEAWAADTVYAAEQLAAPTIKNGFVYRATRLGQPYPAWTPDTPRQVADRVEPTRYTGFYFECVTVSGANPRSGPTEPLWPSKTGAQVTEELVGQEPPADPHPPPPIGPVIDTDTPWWLPGGEQQQP